MHKIDAYFDKIVFNKRLKNSVRIEVEMISELKQTANNIL